MPNNASSSLIRALFKLVGEEINFKSLDNKEISALDKNSIRKKNVWAYKFPL